MDAHLNVEIAVSTYVGNSRATKYYKVLAEGITKCSTPSFYIYQCL